MVDAFKSVPRHELVSESYRPGVEGYQLHQTIEGDASLRWMYADDAIVTRLDAQGRPSSSTSQPSLMALMLHWLDLAPGLRVLEIGAGTGYNAALMAELVGDPSLVTTIDIQPTVVEQTRRHLTQLGYSDIVVRCADGVAGAPDQAPFDRVIVTVGCPDVSWRWVEQMVADGVIVVPLQHGGPNADPVVCLRLSGQALLGQVVSPSGFMSLQGDHPSSPWPDSVAADGSSPDQTLPLFPELAGARQSWWDFAFFLAAVDPRTYFSRILALVDPRGDRVVISPDGIRLWGDRTLLADVRTVYERWRALGQPGLTDWHLTLSPRTGPRPDHDPSAGIWVMERPDSWQTLRLRS